MKISTERQGLKLMGGIIGRDLAIVTGRGMSISSAVFEGRSLLTTNEFPYWTKGLKQQNFGGFLTEVSFSAFSRRTLFDRKAGRRSGDYDMMHLVGRVISDYHIRADLEHASDGGPQKVAFEGCELRGAEQLNAELSQRCAFLGARGPLTRDQLRLPRETPLSDRARLPPLLYTGKGRRHLVAGRRAGHCARLAVGLATMLPPHRAQDLQRTGSL